MPTWRWLQLCTEVYGDASLVCLWHARETPLWESHDRCCFRKPPNWSISWFYKLSLPDLRPQTNVARTQEHRRGQPNNENNDYFHHICEHFEQATKMIPVSRFTWQAESVPQDLYSYQYFSMISERHTHPNCTHTFGSACMEPMIRSWSTRYQNEGKTQVSWYAEGIS